MDGARVEKSTFLFVAKQQFFTFNHLITDYSYSVVTRVFGAVGVWGGDRSNVARPFPDGAPNPQKLSRGSDPHSPIFG